MSPVVNSKMAKRANTVLSGIKDIMRNVQYSNASHQSNLIKLQNLYHDAEENMFKDAFINILSQLFLFDYKITNQYVDRALDFCAAFCISLNSGNEDDPTCLFLVEIFKFTLQYHDVTADKVRFRVCQFVNLLLKHIGNGSLDNFICDQIKDHMLQRILDIKSPIRLQAVSVLQRLQEPQDKNDLVIKQYLKSLLDRNSLVRRKVVECLAPSVDSLPILISRCLDTDHLVRQEVYKKFAKIPVKVLKIEQRQYLLQNGLKDENVKIRKFVRSTLIPSWFESYEENIIDFMSALKLDADEEEFVQTLDIFNQILNCVFKQKSLNELIDVLHLNIVDKVPEVEMTWELAVYWSHLVKYMKSSDNEDLQEKCIDVLPELTKFAEYVKNKLHQLGENNQASWDVWYQDCILREFIKILQTYDYSDEAGRNNTHILIKDVLSKCEVSYEVLVELIKILEIIIPNPDQRFSELYFIIDKLLFPIVEQPLDQHTIRARDVEIAEIRVKLNICKEDLLNAVKIEDFQLSQQYKNDIINMEKKIEEIKVKYSEMSKNKVAVNDTKTLLNCLNIAAAALVSPLVDKFSDSVRQLHDEFILPFLENVSSDVYAAAFKCHCLCCLLDKEMAINRFQFICTPIIASKIINQYNNKALLIAISCFNDFILIYGFGAFSDEPIPLEDRDGSEIGLKANCKFILEIISEMLDHESEEVREKACQCLVKLTGNGLINSPLLLQRLILKWFNPASAKDSRILNMLGNMFLEYTTEISNSTEVIEEAFVPMLKTVISAPNDSPLADIDIESLIRFLCEITRPGRNKYNKDSNSHKNLLISLSNSILNKADEKYVSVYLKILLYLEIPYEDNDLIEKLRKQADAMMKIYKNKSLQNKILRYIKKLDQRLSMSNSTETFLETPSTNSLNTANSSESNVVSSTKATKRRKRKSKSLRPNNLSDLQEYEEDVECDNEPIAHSSHDNELPDMDRLVISESDSDFD